MARAPRAPFIYRPAQGLFTGPYMTLEIPKSLSILREACGRNDVRFEIVDSFSGFVARLSKGTRSHLVGAAGIGVYPINRAAPFAIARDKAFTHYVLQQAGFSVPEGEHFFLRPPHQYILPAGRTRADGLRYAHRLSDGYTRPLVVKPNGGKGAKSVAYVCSEHELNHAFDDISPADEIALIQSFIDAPEYRLFLIDGEIAFAYGKTRATIEGDGHATVRALCEVIVQRGIPRVPDLLNSSYFRAQLEKRGVSANSILPRGMEIPIDFVANISAGGALLGLLEPGPQLRAWARRLASSVSLRVTGVDIFSPSGLADVQDILVTDINGSPNLGTLYDLGYRELVFDVWQTILRKTFDEPWPMEL
jgi:glutathione synthase/RimK-type ligase-like ATP-grasp enzyme